MYIKHLTPINASENVKGILKADENTTSLKNGILKISGIQSSQTNIADDDLEDIIDNYYNKNISLEDIKSIQTVGDVRQANNTDRIKFKIVSHQIPSEIDILSIGILPEQSTIKQVIIDFDHDDLVTSVNNITKALITVQTLGNIGTSKDTHAKLKISTNANNSGGQRDYALRSYLNNEFYNSCNFKNLIKTVIKKSASDRSSSSATIVSNEDNIFLLSEQEVFPSRVYASYNSSDPEGTQYYYFQNTANKIKYNGYEGIGDNSYSIETYGQSQFLRSIHYNYSYAFITVSNSSGDASQTTAPDRKACSIAPAFCL